MAEWLRTKDPRAAHRCLPFALEDGHLFERVVQITVFAFQMNGELVF